MDSKNAVQTTARDESPAKPRPKAVLHWRIPAIMLIGFAIGVLFAGIHLWFYRFWNGRPVANSTQQQWITRGGTAFAFIVKTACAAAAGIAYTQTLWRSLALKQATLGDTDKMFSILSDATMFTSLRVWFGRPELAIIAIIVWLQPLSAIVTPGTIVVHTVTVNAPISLSVPHLEFNNASTPYGVGAEPSGQFQQPTQQVVSVVNAVAYSGAQLSITPPTSNLSYHLDFYGPALSCSNGTAADRSSFQDAIVADLNSLVPGTDEYDTKVTFLAWTTDGGYSLGNPNFNANVSSAQDDYQNALDYNQIFVYASYTNISFPNNVTAADALFECSLSNATYSVDFDFVDGVQNTRVQAITTLDTVHVDPSQATEIDPPGTAYYSIAAAFVDLLVGSIVTVIHYESQRVTSQVQATSLRPFIDGDILDFGPGPQIGNGALADAMKELFTNVTLSLFSNSDFTQLNAPNITAQTTMSRPEYSFKPEDLYLAYGLSLLFTALCVVIGLYNLRRNGQVFSNAPSTILRMHPGSALADDTVGADPLPKQLADAIVTFHPATMKVQEDESGKGAPGHGLRIRRVA